MGGCGQVTGHRLRPAIIGVCVTRTGVWSRLPIAGLEIAGAGTWGVVIDHDLDPVHISLADRPDLRSGVPQVVQEILVHRLGVVVILDDGPFVGRVGIGRALGAPRAGGTAPLPAVARADVDRLAAERAGRLALPRRGGLAHVLDHGGSSIGRPGRFLAAEDRLLARVGDWGEEIGQGNECAEVGVPRLQAKVSPRQRFQRRPDLAHDLLKALVIQPGQRARRCIQADGHRPPLRRRHAIQRRARRDGGPQSARLFRAGGAVDQRAKRAFRVEIPGARPTSPFDTYGSLGGPETDGDRRSPIRPLPVAGH